MFSDLFVSVWFNRSSLRNGKVVGVEKEETNEPHFKIFSFDMPNLSLIAFQVLLRNDKDYESSSKMTKFTAKSVRLRSNIPRGLITRPCPPPPSYL